jgi:hypothetical protein
VMRVKMNEIATSCSGEQVKGPRPYFCQTYAYGDGSNTLPKALTLRPCFTEVELEHAGRGNSMLVIIPAIRC